MKRVMIRYSDREFGYAMYENGEFHMNKHVYTAEDLIQNRAVVTTGDPEVAAEMERIGAPVQASLKQRIVSASLSADTFGALKGALAASGMKQSTVTDELYKFFIRDPKLYAEFVLTCHRKGLYQDDVLMELVSGWMEKNR